MTLAKNGVYDHLHTGRRVTVIDIVKHARVGGGTYVLFLENTGERKIEEYFAFKRHYARFAPQEKYRETSLERIGPE